MKITIGGVEYTVKFEKSRAKIAEDEPLGMIRYTEGTIQVYKKLSPCRIRRVLMHEIVHGVVTNYSIGQLRHEGGVHDERAIDQLAVGLCEALESIGIYLPAEDTGRMLNSLIKLITQLWVAVLHCYIYVGLALVIVPAFVILLVPLVTVSWAVLNLL